MATKKSRKKRPGTVTIRLDNTDFSRLEWLRGFLGGGNATSALKFALKAAYEQQRALQRSSKPVNVALGQPIVQLGPSALENPLKGS